MTPEAFLQVAREQLDLVPWLHTINPEASAADLEAWKRAYPGYSLPEDPALLVTPLKGLEVGYAPIVPGQTAARN